MKAEDYFQESSPGAAELRFVSRSDLNIQTRSDFDDIRKENVVRWRSLFFPGDEWHSGTTGHRRSRCEIYPAMKAANSELESISGTNETKQGPDEALASDTV